MCHLLYFFVNYSIFYYILSLLNIITSGELYRCFGGGISSFLPYNSTILQYFSTTGDIYKRPLITPLGGTIFDLNPYFIKNLEIFNKKYYILFF